MNDKQQIIEKGIFIANIEGVDLINHVERERGFNIKYKGVLPYSLESIHLAGLEEFEISKYVNPDENIYNRIITKDVINVKFSCGQMNKEDTIEYVTKKFIKRIFKLKKVYKKKMNYYLNRMENENKEEYERLNNIIEMIKKDEHTYNERTAEQIRDILYVDGFTIKKTIYPALIKEHDKYNKEVAEALNTQKKLLKKEKDETKKAELEKGIKLIFEELETEIISTNYKMWKRSSSKSRTGQILFIKDTLLKEMNSWGRMMLELPIDQIVDIVGLSAYSSLVGSHIEKILTIKPSNILIVPDVLSCFDIEANVVRKEPCRFKKFTLRKEAMQILTPEDILKLFKKKWKITTIEKERHLKSYREMTTIKSSLLDGQSILDSSYFEDGQSMMLLRQHFFKSASFNGKVIQFLKDQYGDRYETAEITDLFGNRMRVSQVHMIITPNSLKALKFSEYVTKDNDGNYIGTEKEMYKYWKKIVTKDSNVFGVCKHEKESKQGTEHIIKRATIRKAEINFEKIDRKKIKTMNITNKYGKPIQQMSYQHVNSLRADKESIKELAEWEINYINNAKNDIEVYKDLLKKEANFMNSNEMLADLCNTDFIHTKMFKKQRSQTISKYVKKIKSGKVKIVSDNLVIIGNPYLMLLHAINKLDGELNDKNEFILDKDYEDETLPISKDYIACSTKLFNDEEMVVTFRNPHTSSNNCGLSKNFYNDKIDTYFNFSKNIIAVNLVRTEFQNIHSDSDQDSDFVLCSNNSALVNIVKKSFRKDLVCVNAIPSKVNDYTLTNADMSKMDNTLAQSKDIIGTVVNLGQLAMSEYYHTTNNGIDESDPKAVSRLERLEEIVIVMTILSGCAIDNAKRTYDIDMDAEIKHIVDSGLITKKPIFWEYVSSSTKKKNNEIRDNNREIEKKNEKLKESNNNLINYQKLKTTKMSCTMEFLGEILSDKEIIPKADDDKIEYEISDLIVDITGKAKGEVSDKIIELAGELDKEIATYNAKKSDDKDELKEQTNELDNKVKGIMDEINKRKISEKTMQMILKNHIADEDSNVKYKLRLMNILYQKDKDMFKTMFHKCI